MWKNDEDHLDLKTTCSADLSGFSPVCHDVENGCFVTVVVLQKNHTLDSASRKYLESLGIAVDVKGHATSVELTMSSWGDGKYGIVGSRPHCQFADGS